MREGGLDSDKEGWRWDHKTGYIVKMDQDPGDADIGAKN